MKFSKTLLPALLLFINFAQIYAQSHKYSIKLGISPTSSMNIYYSNNINFSEDSLTLSSSAFDTNFSPTLTLRFERVYGKNAVWTSAIYFNSRNAKIVVTDEVYDSTNIFPFPDPRDQFQDKLFEVDKRETNIALSTGLLWQLNKKENSRFNLNIGPSIDVHYYKNLDYYFDQIAIALNSYEDQGISFGLDAMLDFSFQITPKISVGLLYSLNLAQGNINLGEEKYSNGQSYNNNHSYQQSKGFYQNLMAVELGYRF